MLPKSIQKPLSGALFLKPQHRQTMFAKNCTPPMRKPHFCISRTFKNCSFSAKKSLPKSYFFAMPLGTQFFQFSTTKIIFSGPTWSPTWDPKHHFLYKSASGDQQPSQDLPRYPKPPPGPLRNSFIEYTFFALDKLMHQNPTSSRLLACVAPDSDPLSPCDPARAAAYSSKLA